MQWLQHKKARSHTEVMNSPPQNHFHQPRQLVKEPIMKVMPDQYSIWKPCYFNFYRCGQIFFDNLFVPHAVIFFGLNPPLLEIIKEEISHLESILKLFISNMRDIFFPCAQDLIISPPVNMSTLDTHTWHALLQQFWGLVLDIEVLFTIYCLELSEIILMNVHRNMKKLLERVQLKQINTRFFRCVAPNSVPRLRCFWNVHTPTLP